MLTAEIIRVEQALNLHTRETENFLVFRIPSGTELRAVATEEVVESILAAADLDTEEAVPEAPSPPPQVPLDSPKPPVLEEEVYWMDLGAEVLPDELKAAFSALSAPELLTMSAVIRLRDSILLEFQDEDWELLAKTSLPPVAPPKQEPPPPRQPQSPPGLDQVRWADGSAVFLQSRPARTVPKDDAGYPIVDSSRDPGEVVVGSHDLDEDGMAQL